MIGQLILPATATGDDSALRATLQDDLTWQCDDPEWATMLNARFPGPAEVHIMPAAGRFLLYRAAERLSARVEVAKRDRPMEMA